MGIPRYFKYIIKSFKGLLYNAPNETIHPMHFYLDMNSIIHPCVQHCIEKFPAYVAEQNRIQSDRSHAYHKDANYHTRFEKTVYAELETRLHHLICDIVRPTQTLYLAIDGVAPRAKMEQQRIRRYKSVYESKRQRSIFEKYGIQDTLIQTWDRNAITPGTIFLYKLCRHLEQSFLPAIKKEMSIANVYMDSANSHGEGEHKIFDWIRENFPVSYVESDSTIPKEFHCIYGLDADLIMLSLCNPNSIVLLRESPEYFDKNDSTTQLTSEHIYFHMDAYKEHLLDNMTSYIDALRDYDTEKGDDDAETHDTQLSRQGFLYDYVWMCFIFGNDFLPHFFGFEITKDSFEALMKQYANQFTVLKRHFIDPKSSKMDIIAVKQWFDTLYGREGERIKRYVESAIHKKPYMGHNVNNKYPQAVQGELEELSIEPYRLRHSSKVLSTTEQSFREIDNPYQNWRDIYNKWYFGIESLDVNREFIDSICSHYLYGLEWNIQYYLSGCRDQMWYYPFRAAPSLRELCMYLTKQLPILSPLGTQQNTAYRPVEQLLFVLPSSSFDIIPYESQKWLRERPLYEHYYPVEIELDMLFKMYLYECPPLLPYLPEEVIRMIIKDTESKWNAFDKERNAVFGAIKIDIK
jgi:5'-3' exoribonuclease 1